MTTPYERFQKKYEVDAKSGCWLWAASRMPNGYPQFRYNSAKNGYAHRFAYEHFIGPIPDGAQLDHLCRVIHCVNPAHLEIVTPRENVRRSEGVAALNRRKTHCKRGHLLAGDNLRVAPDGRRICRTCMAEHQKHWREANREQFNAYQRDYARERYASDDAYRERRKQASREQKRAKPEPSPPPLQ